MFVQSHNIPQSEHQNGCSTFLFINGDVFFEKVPDCFLDLYFLNAVEYAFVECTRPLTCLSLSAHLQ